MRKLTLFDDEWQALVWLSKIAPQASEPGQLCEEVMDSLCSLGLAERDVDGVRVTALGQRIRAVSPPQYQVRGTRVWFLE